MSAPLALQRLLREAFVASPAVLALVPSANIVDRHLRPAPAPSVILGGAMAGPGVGDVGRDRVEMFHDLHIWTEEGSTEGAWRIIAALEAALPARSAAPLEGGYHLADISAFGAQVLRDPDGKSSHGILTVRALIGGAA